jgi:hypothetical protein
VSPPVAFVIGAKATCDVVIRARIYEDSLPEPTVKELTLTIEVAESSFDAMDILKDVILEPGKAEQKK